MDLALYIPAFVTLFVIIDPVGLAPLFVALTQGMTISERRKVAIRACRVARGSRPSVARRPVKMTRFSRDQP
jgi:multiple antibiotic resistance protein